MLRLTLSAGATSLFAGLAVAAALSGVAVVTVAHAGCEHPGTYQPRGGVVELIGGCVTPDDLPYPHAPQPREPLGNTPAVAP